MAALSAERSTLALEALNRISVSEPYYALTDIAWGVDGETLIATVPPIPPAHPEVQHRSLVILPSLDRVRLH